MSVVQHNPLLQMTFHIPFQRTNYAHLDYWYFVYLFHYYSLVYYQPFFLCRHFHPSSSHSHYNIGRLYQTRGPYQVLYLEAKNYSRIMARHNIHPYQRY